jgi:hypothetical protein
MDVTNGLGYEPINHHEDTSEGLIRHLGEMYLRIKENSSKFDEKFLLEFFNNMLVMDDFLKYWETKNPSYLKEYKGIIEAATNPNEGQTSPQKINQKILW